MSLIKCPECGKEISDTCDKCIHCGYKISFKSNSIEIKKPIDDSWINHRINEIKSNKRKKSIIFGILSSLFLIPSIIFIVLSFVVDYRDFYKFLIFFSIFSIGFIVFLGLTVVYVIPPRTKVRKYDNYSIMVLVGFDRILFIEDEIQDRGVYSRFLYGKLPNGKDVEVSISFWDGNPRIDIR